MLCSACCTMSNPTNGIWANLFVFVFSWIFHIDIHFVNASIVFLLSICKIPKSIKAIQLFGPTRNGIEIECFSFRKWRRRRREKHICLQMEGVCSWKMSECARAFSLLLSLTLTRLMISSKLLVGCYILIFVDT